MKTCKEKKITEKNVSIEAERKKMEENNVLMKKEKS